jgi:hypothetical protein
MEELIGEEDSLSLLHKGDNRCLEEGQMFIGGRTSCESLGFSGVKLLVLCPWRCGEGDCEGHSGRGDPAAGQSSWGASQNQREGGNPG